MRRRSAQERRDAVYEVPQLQDEEVQEIGPHKHEGEYNYDYSGGPTGYHCTICDERVKTYTVMGRKNWHTLDEYEEFMKHRPDFIPPKSRRPREASYVFVTVRK